MHTHVGHPSRLDLIHASHRRRSLRVWMAPRAVGCGSMRAGAATPTAASRASARPRGLSTSTTSCRAGSAISLASLPALAHLPPRRRPCPPEKLLERISSPPRDLPPPWAPPSKTGSPAARHSTSSASRMRSRCSWRAVAPISCRKLLEAYMLVLHALKRSSTVALKAAVCVRGAELTLGATPCCSGGSGCR